MTGEAQKTREWLATASENEITKAQAAGLLNDLLNANRQPTTQKPSDGMPQKPSSDPINGDPDGEWQRYVEELAAQQQAAQPTPGDANQGARGGGGVVPESPGDLASYSPEQIVAAYRNGRLDHLLSGSRNYQYGD